MCQDFTTKLDLASSKCQDNFDESKSHAEANAEYEHDEFVQEESSVHTVPDENNITNKNAMGGVQSASR